MATALLMVRPVRTGRIKSGRTRVFVTTRSWLDAGVEVLPGDRKFNDYAFPQSTSFAQENFKPPARSSATVPVL